MEKTGFAIWRLCLEVQARLLQRALVAEREQPARDRKALAAVRF